MITVEIYGYDSNPQRVQVPIQPGMRISHAIKSTGVADEFNRMDITLVRIPPGSQMPHRMDVKFDTAKRSVEPVLDYALQPNDRLVIEQDTSTILDDLLSRFGDL